MTSVTSGTLVLGDVGKPLVISAGGLNLMGATVSLLISQGAASSVTLGPLAISSDGIFATYTTTGTEFTSSGLWNLQLQVVNPPANPWFSPPGTIFVFPHL